MFRKINLKDGYSSEEDDLYNDFFIPTLSEAVTYRRAVGFFSLGVLLNTPTALTHMVSNNGKIQLIFGKLTSLDDFEAIKLGVSPPWREDDFPNFSELIEQNKGNLLEFRIRILAWLFSNGNLKMKVALRPKGMFHQKVGLLQDRLGDAISFSGSMNETMSAVDPRYNSEEIKIFRSWADGQKNYVQSDAEKFDKLWSGDTGSSTVICSIPEVVSEGLQLVDQQFSEPPTKFEEDRRMRAFLDARTPEASNEPRIPTSLNGSPFSIRPHQREALRAWKDNGCNGILELATGSGKTITALYAATKTIEANQGIAVIVAVPYQDLADQWCDELRLFNIYPIRCYGARQSWETQVNAYLRRNANGQRENLAIVAVNKTLKTDHFQNFVSQLEAEKIFFIGDECHHHGSSGYVGKLIETARFRIGLSATPFHYLDTDANDRLLKVYAKSVFKYTLADAVRDKVLTPYEYTPIPVELTDFEAQEYLDLSAQISRAFAASKSDTESPTGERLKSLLMKRARLVGAAENKIMALEALLEADNVSSHSLFYCSDGRTLVTDDGEEEREVDQREVKQRYAVAEVLRRKKVRVSPFTSDESRWERRKILESFKDGETQALIAIRCLDEGIDVPACQTAYLLASSKNPRQFIQRRGRILRRAPNKEFAKIFDFVVVLPESQIVTEELATDFLRNELDRVADFAQNSLYPSSSVKPLEPWLQSYDLEHHVG